MKSSFKIYHFLLILAIVIFAAIGFVLFDYYSEGQKEQQVFDDLIERITQAEITENNNQYPSSRYLLAYSENSDYVGWLSVPGTAIDYPVMQTPDDPQFYLHHSFDKSESKSGTLFIGEGCDKDSKSLIIYGHNMKNDTMFGSLDLYKEQSFWEENPYFYFETEKGLKKYQIFSAEETKIPDAGSSEMRYYDQVGDLSDDEYNGLLDWLKANEMYATGNEPKNGEQIVMLSTCSYHTDDGRFMIAGKEVVE